MHSIPRQPRTEWYRKGTVLVAHSSVPIQEIGTLKRPSHCKGPMQPGAPASLRMPMHSRIHERHCLQPFTLAASIPEHLTPEALNPARETLPPPYMMLRTSKKADLVLASHSLNFKQVKLTILSLEDTLRNLRHKTPKRNPRTNTAGSRNPEL